MEYSIIYSKRKTLSLSVDNGKVIVKAPIGTQIEYIQGVIEKHARWIAKTLEADRRKSNLYQSLTDDDVKRLKKNARVYFNDKTEYYSKLMGLKYGRITITSAQKRFGSCSSEGNICFSYRLMLYPEEAREYVIVHELAHLKEMNHSARFYKIVESVLPDYKLRRKMLK